ncbi:MAG: transglycosylase SLT domain-containing protein, partial [Prevotellaceae bacterium]|nr:transglycosylase SLT domain-containing protein [Prevotellaceae bacterium]
MKQNCFLLFVFCLLFFACNNKGRKTDLHATLPLPADTLRVVTMYSPTAYFMYRDEYMGYDYELVCNFGKYLKLPIKITVAQNEKEMAALLNSGAADIAAYNTIQTKELKQNLTFVFPQNDSYQILVQNKNKTLLNSIRQLNGDTVSIKENSVFHDRLKSINQEIGGGIIIRYMTDTLSNEDLIELVATDSVKYTLAYYNTALLYKSYYPNLDLTLHVGFPQRNGWMVSNRSIDLQREIAKWEEQKKTKNLEKKLYAKYWHVNYQLSNEKIHTPKGSLSPYDAYFKKYAHIVGWDWRLITAVAHTESRFSARELSWAGAVGVMQLMPVTAHKMGLKTENFFNPELNIQAGVTYLKWLDNNYSNAVPDANERVKFVLASYNAGPAHILDAIALAKKHGRNPAKWDDNVEYFLIKKNEPEYYNDPVVQ